MNEKDHILHRAYRSKVDYIIMILCVIGVYTVTHDPVHQEYDLVSIA